MCSIHYDTIHNQQVHTYPMDDFSDFNVLPFCNVRSTFCVCICSKYSIYQAILSMFLTKFQHDAQTHLYCSCDETCKLYLYTTAQLKRIKRTKILNFSLVENESRIRVLLYLCFIFSQFFIILYYKS